MKRSNFQVIIRLFSLMTPMIGTIILAVLLGTLGNLCAIFVPVTGAYALLGSKFDLICIILPLLAVARGICRYAEQNRNHYLAFKILALIRDKVFGALRILSPAKLEGRDKGDLIALLTADVELLEVFYAHTISPVCIAAIVNIVMIVLIGSFHPLLGLLSFCSYCVVGIAIPLVGAKHSRSHGENFRSAFAELDAFVLDNLRGIRESMQYGAGQQRLKEIYAKTDSLAAQEKHLKNAAGWAFATTSGVIFLLDLLMLAAAIILYSNHLVSFSGAVISVVALMSSFGPTIALADLGISLQNTFAAGNRVLDVLDELPVVREVTNGKDISFSGATCKNVNFAYESEPILTNFSLDIPQNMIVGIKGKSGSGKSTLLKLLMRFWDIDSGSICISQQEINTINTVSLRSAESFVTQDTQLFHDSIERNLLIANPHASEKQIVEACKRASIHNFIMTLPQGYKTPVGELGETLSGGERQRLGLARAFLHDAPFILLDEPTSNLDSLNEAVILKSLQDYREEKTVIIVSHRKSTMCIADKVISIANGRMS